MAENNVDNKPVSGILVPIAIVLGGALIIWAITKMLSSDTGYKRLVEELHSKTFGNRWVAAYELSKYISSSQIPEEDVPWLVDQLTTVYEESPDPRTKNFIVLTLGALDHPGRSVVFNKALNETDEKILFSSVIAIGNLKNSNGIDFQSVIKLLDSDDSGLVQVAILALISHNQVEAKQKMLTLLESSSPAIRYSAASGALAFGELSALPVVKEIFELKASEQLDESQVQALQLNALTALEKSKNLNNEVLNFIESLSQSDLGLVVQTRAKQLLIMLKKP